MGIYSASSANDQQTQYMTNMNSNDLLGNGNMGGAESTMERLLTNHQVERRLHYKFNVVIMLMIFAVQEWYKGLNFKLPEITV